MTITYNKWTIIKGHCQVRKGTPEVLKNIIPHKDCKTFKIKMLAQYIFTK